MKKKELKEINEILLNQNENLRNQLENNKEAEFQNDFQNAINTLKKHGKISIQTEFEYSEFRTKRTYSIEFTR